MAVAAKTPRSSRSAERHPGTAARAPRAGERSPQGRETLPDAVLAELIRRVQEIEAAYREVAQMMGQLYMYSDRHGLGSLTRAFDRPMRTASDNERVMASILGELQLNASRRQQRGN